MITAEKARELSDSANSNTVDIQKSVISEMIRKEASAGHDLCVYFGYVYEDNISYFRELGYVVEKNNIYDCIIRW